MLVLASLLAGLFGGAGWSAAWELWLRPRRDRRSIARALSAEIEGNVKVSETLLRSWNPSFDPIPFVPLYSTLVFTSLAPRLGDVDLDVLQDLIWLYRDFDQLNSFSAQEAETRQSGIAPLRIRAERELAGAFARGMAQMLLESVKVREGLSLAATGTRSRPPVPTGITPDGGFAQLQP